MNKGYDAGLLAIFGAAFLVMGILAGALAFPVHKTDIVKDVQVVYVNKTVPVQSPEVSYLYHQATISDRQEDKSKSLVSEEMALRSFKKEVFNALKNNASIEDYKDIYKIKVKDIDVDLSDEEANVTVEFKAYYYIDGDDEETGRALLTSVFNVDELSDEDNYTDSEVVDYTVTLNKIYE